MNIIEFVEKYVCLRKKDGSVEKLKLREYQKKVFGDVGEKENEERMAVVIGYHPFLYV